MAMRMKADSGRVAAFLDIGTNAVRLLMVRLNPNHSYTVLTRQREAVRLGEGEFADDELQEAAMDRAVLVCKRFAEMARSYGAHEIHAVATSASREAKNQDQFLARLLREAQVDVRIISGKEEARLVYLGVSSGLKLGKRQALFIDIGGGSTELAVGDQHQHTYLDTLKLGAIRLTSLFFLPGETEPVPAARYSLIQRHVRNVAVRAVQHIRERKLDLAVGSAGTIVSLGDIAARRFHDRPLRKDDVLTHAQLQEVIQSLCDMSLEERRRVPGMLPDRADIIIAGAAVLDTLMEDLDLKEIRVSERGLRDGLLMDYLYREQAHPYAEMSVRERSVVQLGRACNFDEAHGRTVERLAQELFDSAREAGLHDLGEWERELLGYAGLLHDIGIFISYTDHQAHSSYIIRHADLLGFDQTELSILAATSLFHGKALPKKNRSEYAALDKRSRRIVKVLCILLRMAESLDRSHSGIVQHARLRAGKRGTVLLEIEASQDCQLEVWGMQMHERSFERVFKKALVVEGPETEE